VVDWGLRFRTDHPVLPQRPILFGGHKSSALQTPASMISTPLLTWESYKCSPMLQQGISLCRARAFFSVATCLGSEECGRAAIDVGLCLGSEGGHIMLGWQEEEHLYHGRQKGASVFRQDEGREA
jgi:hypothetical protein